MQPSAINASISVSENPLLRKTLTESAPLTGELTGGGVREWVNRGAGAGSDVLFW